MTPLTELKKGCGVYPCGNIHKFPTGKKIILCPTCQARLEGFQAGQKQEREDVLKLIDDRLKEYEELKKESLGVKRSNCIEIIKELKQELTGGKGE